MQPVLRAAATTNVTASCKCTAAHPRPPPPRFVVPHLRLRVRLRIQSLHAQKRGRHDEASGGGRGCRGQRGCKVDSVALTPVLCRVAIEPFFAVENFPSDHRKNVLVLFVPESKFRERREDGREEKRGGEQVGSPVPLNDFACVRLRDFLVVIIDQPAAAVKQLRQAARKATATAYSMYLTSCTASCTYMRILLQLCMITPSMRLSRTTARSCRAILSRSANGR